MIHIYYGDGKGKTTAAVGLALRASGCGMRVLFVQFLKTEFSGERKALRNTQNVTLTTCPLEMKFTFDMTEQEKQQTAVMFRKLFDGSASTTLSNRYDMVVFDEIFDVINENMLSETEVFEFTANAPKSLEIVMTGHNPPQRFIDAADYVTEFKKVKHPFDKGVTARKGIEY
ncbi:MAG TPA: cob(I)yrinic acid a,c-diamide adenosyltransferase [Ruminococcaceae bacterium]|nr:cob(I)yrinic acid a,c-diamide adenosyltransferase [Oscillospiraceae bacterium]